MRKRVVGFFLCLSCVLLMTLSGAGFSLASDTTSQDASMLTDLTADEQDYIMQHQDVPLVVAVSDDMAPAEYYDANSASFAGFTVDVFDLIAHKTGLTFTLTTRRSNAETRQKLADGELQIVSALADRPEVADALDVAVSDPFFTNTVSLVSKNTWSGSGDPDSIVAVKSGYPVFAQIAKSLGYKKIVEYGTFAECVEVVNSGKADITLISTTGENVLLGHAYYADLTSIQLSDTVSEYSIGVAKNGDTEVLLSILNKALDSIPPEQITQMRLHNVLNAQPEHTARDVLYESRASVLIMVIAFISVVLIAVLINMRQKRKANAVLQSSNDQLQKALAEREKAVDEAHRASSAKSEFLSHMSHDMRTPLNAVLGFTELAKDEPELPAQTADYLGKIEDSGKYLLELINDVLDMSKIESGKLELHEDTVNIPLFLEGIASVFTVQAREKGIRLITDFSQLQMPWVVIDELRSHQIYANLLSNAIKFSDSGTEICWTVTGTVTGPDTMHVVSFISDQGFGMSEDYMSRMFQPFEQGDPEGSAAGTGLGLTIVKNLVESMGGTIRVESEFGRGSSFVIELDRRLGVPPSEDAAEAEAEDSVTSMAILGGVRILLCEDNLINVMVARKLLEKVGCVVECAENGKIGVDMFSASEPGYFGAILMDIRMPVMDGLAAAQAIRKLDRPDAKTVSIVAMSANAFDEDVQKSLEAGMNAHLAKPIESQKLYRTLASLVSDSVSGGRFV